MTKRQCKNRVRTSTVNMDTMKRNPYKYGEKWAKRIKLLARDFYIANDLVVDIIEETKNFYVGREREDIMYNYAHKKLMELLKN